MEKQINRVLKGLSLIDCFKTFFRKDNSLPLWRKGSKYNKKSKNVTIVTTKGAFGKCKFLKR